MICGYVGCGRYIEADALAHYELSKHSLAFNLEGKVIWSYILDTFVHTVLESEWRGGDNPDDDQDSQELSGG